MQRNREICLNCAIKELPNNNASQVFNKLKILVLEVKKNDEYS